MALDIGAVVVALISLAGLLFTNRQTNTAKNRATAVEEQANTDSGWQKLASEQRSQLTEQRGQINELWLRVNEGREVQERNEALVDQLRRRTAQLEQRLDDYVHRYRVAIRYVSQLREFIATNLAGDTAMPEPPEDLSFDLADPVEIEEEHPPGWPPTRR